MIEVDAGHRGDPDRQQLGRVPRQDHDLMDATLLVAVAAGAVAVVALGVCVALWISPAPPARRPRRCCCPTAPSAGLVDRQASLQRAHDPARAGPAATWRAWSSARARSPSAACATALRFQGMVRYDAYRDMGGSQSWSIALIDGNQTGAVVTSPPRPRPRPRLPEGAGRGHPRPAPVARGGARRRPRDRARPPRAAAPPSAAAAGGGARAPGARPASPAGPTPAEPAA